MRHVPSAFLFRFLFVSLVNSFFPFPLAQYNTTPSILIFSFSSPRSFSLFFSNTL